MEGVEIVTAGRERLDALAPLWKSLSAHHGELTPSELPVRSPEEAWPARHERYREALQEGAVLFIAERSGEALGFAFARPRAAPESLAVDRLLEVETVAVAPAARGAGIGSALIDALDAWAREQRIDHLTVSVRTDNEGARRLYERRGFRPLYETMFSILAPPDR